MLVLLTCVASSGAWAEEEETGELRLLTTDSSVSKALQQALVSQFSEDNPNVRISVSERIEGDSVVERARSGSFDATFLERSSVSNLLQTYGLIERRLPLLESHFVLLVPAGSPESVVESTTLAEAFEQLAKRRSLLLLPPAGSAIGESIQNLVSQGALGSSLKVEFFPVTIQHV